MAGNSNVQQLFRFNQVKELFRQMVLEASMPYAKLTNNSAQLLSLADQIDR